jgi:hypothetical protein
MSLQPCSLNGLVKMQTAARYFGHEPVSVMLMRWLRGYSVSGSKLLSRAPFVCGMALPNLSSARSPTKRHYLDRTSVSFKPYPLYNTVSHCCPYQSSARMLSQLYAVVDLEAGLWEPGSLVWCRFSRFLALWICGFAVLG